MEIANKAADGSLVLCIAQNVPTVYLRNLETKNPQFKKYTAKRNKASSFFELAFGIYIGSVAYLRKKNANRVYSLR